MATDVQGCHRDAHDLVRQLGNAQQVAAKLFQQVVALTAGDGQHAGIQLLAQLADNLCVSVDVGVCAHALCGFIIGIGTTIT